MHQERVRTAQRREHPWVSVASVALAAAPVALVSIVALFAVQVWAEPLEAKSAKLSKEDILAAVEANWSRIEDLSVSYSAPSTTAPSNNLFVRYHERVVIKGDKTYFYREFGPSPEIEKMMLEREVAFNGKRTAIHEVNRGLAMVETKRQPETETRDWPYVELMLLSPPRSTEDPAWDGSLISVLRSKLSQVRENLEVVDGHPCYVVELTDPEAGKPMLVVSLDAERGFIPVRQLWYGGSARQYLGAELTIEDAVEVENGLWFATRGSRRSRIPGEGLEDRWSQVGRSLLTVPTKGNRP